MQILESLNSYSGLLTFIVTTVYVVATIFILKSNKKSADAAEKQIKESEEMRELTFKTQKQNVVLAQFQTRYGILAKANELLCYGELVNKQALYEDIFINFRNALTKECHEKDLIQMNEELISLKREQASIIIKEDEKVDAKNDELYIELYNKFNEFTDKIYRRRLHELNKEISLVMMSKFCFEEEVYVALKKYCDALKQLAEVPRAADDRVGACIQALRKAHQNIMDKEIIVKLEQKLRVDECFDK